MLVLISFVLLFFSEVQFLIRGNMAIYMLIFFELQYTLNEVLHCHMLILCILCAAEFF